MPRQFRTELPTFESVEENRAHRKELLAAALGIFSDCSFSEGVAGQVTASDPDHPEPFWANPLGRNCGLIRESDLPVDDFGRLVEGSGPVTAAGIAVHAAVHQARPDDIASAHAHSFYDKAWTSLGHLLDSITQDACRLYGDHSLFDDYNGIVLDPEEGKRLARVLTDHKAVTLRKHGLLTVGGTLDEATWWLATMERPCQAPLIAEPAGNPIRVDHEVVAATRGEVGSRRAGWFAFQSPYERVVRDHSDLLG